MKKIIYKRSGLGNLRMKNAIFALKKIKIAINNMKKITQLTITILSILFCLISCNNTEGKTTEGIDNKSKESTINIVMKIR